MKCFRLFTWCVINISYAEHWLTTHLQLCWVAMVTMCKIMITVMNIVKQGMHTLTLLQSFLMYNVRPYKLTNLILIPSLPSRLFWPLFNWPCTCIVSIYLNAWLKLHHKYEQWEAQTMCESCNLLHAWWKSTVNVNLL